MVRQADPLAGAEGLTSAVAEAAAEARAIGRLVAEAWRDDRGREVTETFGRLGRVLDEQADRLAELVRDLVDALAAADRGGVRLPGSDGRRASEERGVRLPLLGEDLPGAGPVR